MAQFSFILVIFTMFTLRFFYLHFSKSFISQFCKYFIHFITILVMNNFYCFFIVVFDGLYYSFTLLPIRSPYLSWLLVYITISITTDWIKLFKFYKLKKINKLKSFIVGLVLNKLTFPDGCKIK